MHSLPVFVRLTGETVLVLGEGEAADAKRRLVERAGGIVTDDPSAPARFAFIALKDKQEMSVAAALLKSRGMFVNVADMGDLCDFTLPAIVDRDPVIVAIGTGGASAGLAKALRQRIEALLPAKLGDLARALFARRAAIRARWPDADDRRRAIDEGLADGGKIDPMRQDSSDAIERWIAEAGTAEAVLHHIIITSDDPDDLTLKAARLLGQADEIWHEAAIAPAILHRARADAKRAISETPPPDSAATGGRIIIWLTKA